MSTGVVLFFSMTVGAGSSGGGVSPHPERKMTDKSGSQKVFLRGKVSIIGSFVCRIVRSKGAGKPCREGHTNVGNIKFWATWRST